MSYQNSIAKESLSLQNHIVRPCFIFITQNTPIMHNPGFSQAIGSYFLTRFSFFLILTLYMSVSHGRSTMVVYGGGCKDNREKIVSHQLGVSTGYGDAHQQILMSVSRDCQATDALELQVYESSTKETRWVCIQLACS